LNTGYQYNNRKGFKNGVFHALKIKVFPEEIAKNA